MIVKLSCWKDINTTHVMFVDSDCIFNKPYNASLVLNKMAWYYVTETEEPGVKGGFDTWKVAVQRMTGLPMTKYYMANAFPFIVKKQTLEAADLFFVNKHKQPYDVFCMKELARLKINVGGGVLPYWPTIAQVFEEFEYLGWFAEHFTNDYDFYTGERRDQSPPIAQFWSHGGITEEIRTQNENILA
jgi:hypothetical protein